MATNNEGVDSALSFPLRVQGIREQIDTHFLQLHQQLETRRDSLIKRLEEISQDYESKCGDQRTAISQLEDLKTHTNKSLKENLVQDFVTQNTKHIDEQILALNLKIEYTPQPVVAWQWQESRVSELIAGLGEIECGTDSCSYNRTNSHNKDTLTIIPMTLK